MILYIIILLILLTALWNGLVIKWGLENDKVKVTKISKYWHGIGFIVRGLLVAIIYLITYNWYWTGIAAFLCWLPYNMIINKVNGWKLFYFGQSSWIDRLMNKLL